MNRRSFIKQSALTAAGSAFVPLFLKGFEQRKFTGHKNLVIIQLSGGNDGLNTIVPFQNDIYYKKRPTLAIQADEVLKLNDELGLNPALLGFKSLYDDGLVSIINNVGYPDPDRSHFRSMDIWHTASDSNQYLSTGWLGRFLDKKQASDAHFALELDDSLSLTLKGDNHSGFAISNPRQMKRITDSQLIQKIAHHHDHDHTENVAYLYQTLGNTISSADYLFEQSKIYKSTRDFGNNQFGKDVKQVSELICSGTSSRIYYVNLTGFDTHAGQKNRQERLLKQYATGVKALCDDLKSKGKLEDTLILTFSEFGRRVAQNGSNGTDHGTANNLFMIGGRLKKQGLFNAGPDLANLDNGDLKYKIDFRSVYASVLQNWLGIDHSQILGKQFNDLGIV